VYTEILDYVETFIKNNVLENGGVETGYLGEFPVLDLRAPHILLEPKFDEREADSTRWDKATYKIVLWIMVGFDLDYKKSVNETEKLLSGPVGLHEALKKLKVDPDFAALSTDPKWRVKPPLLKVGRTQFGIMQKTEYKINTAQINLDIYLNIEK
jgi:hypothetical protein